MELDEFDEKIARVTPLGLSDVSAMSALNQRVIDMLQLKVIAQSEEIAALKIKNHLVLDALNQLKDSFMQDDQGRTKGNQAKTDIITYNEDVRLALNNAQETLWKVGNNG